MQDREGGHTTSFRPAHAAVLDKLGGIASSRSATYGREVTARRRILAIERLLLIDLLSARDHVKLGTRLLLMPVIGGADAIHDR
jgi:hypothetical protein